MERYFSFLGNFEVEPEEIPANADVVHSVYLLNYEDENRVYSHNGEKYIYSPEWEEKTFKIIARTGRAFVPDSPAKYEE